MPCFAHAHKRLASPPRDSARGPPPKRVKIVHPAALSDPPRPDGALRTHAAAALFSNADRTQHNARPLTIRHAPGGTAAQPRDHDRLAPEHMPQTLLSWTASHHKRPQRAAKSAVVSPNSCAHATPEDGCYKTTSDALAPLTAARLLPSLCPSASVLPMAYNFHQPGPSTSRVNQLSFGDNTCEAWQPIDPLLVAPRMPSAEGDALNYLYEGLDNYPYDFSQDLLSQFDFTAGDQLSETHGCDPDAASPNPRSPIFRSMSRSSFGSSSYTESSPPGDYPTPASDSSVTTPAPSEAAFGWTPEIHHPLFGEEQPLGREAKAKDEPECSYVQHFSGSAPLSPNALLAFGFDVCLPEGNAAPSTASGALTSSRRHSEPTNLAVLQFPAFLQELSQIPFLPPVDATTRPIADNLASCSSAAPPSSIAPHQTQLPRALEIVSPKPVRAFKPPILAGECHYEPKDFVRRHSEPILPLRELDICSHVPLDATEECSEEEDEDAMMFDGSEQDMYDVDGSDDMCYEDTADEFSPHGLDAQAFAAPGQGEPLFDPDWSWLQAAPSAHQPSQPWPTTDMLSSDFDWSTAFTSPVPPSLAPGP
ncbi:hypothetical protein BD413DRAFT_490038 [Trametes elegans]|nr:hypothetical protein BD413DRAFT_490038 [Trametes elegans]